MRTLVFILTAFFTSTICAQDCSRFYPLKEGTSMTYQMYDKKQRPEGTITYLISDVTQSGGATKATMSMTLETGKGEPYTSSYDLTCEDNYVQIDFESLMNNEMIEQFGDGEVEVTGTDLELPNQLEVGQALKDANVNVRMNMGALNMNMSVETVNRKVEKRESVTTPAGTFDCFVIYSENHSKMMLGKQKFPSRVWLAEDVGMVKQETYNKNGKLMSSMLLTELSR